MYHGEVAVPTQDLSRFLTVAEQFQVRGLVEDVPKVGGLKNICAVQKISVPRQLGAVPVSSSRYQSKRPRLLQEEDEPSVETVDQVRCDWSRGAMTSIILISDWSRRTEARCLGPEVRRAATSLRTIAAWWVWCAPGAASSAGASQSYRSASGDL